MSGPGEPVGGVGTLAPPAAFVDASDCAHCGLPLPRVPVDRRFCCAACRLVWRAIHEAGLDGYYERRGPAPQRAAELPREMAWLSRPEVQVSYVVENGGLLQASFLLDGLHCAACAWLIEQTVERLEGVREARVNYATSRLRVRWEAAALGLGDIAHAVSRIGYRATPYNPNRLEQPRVRQGNDLLLRMAVAGFCAGNVMLIAAALYAGALSGMDERYRQFFHLVSFALATPVVLWSAVPFYRGALAALRARAITMDVPICCGLLTVYVYSVWATLQCKSEVYFDTAATFVFVLLVGRVIENASRGRVSDAVERLLALGPRTALLLRDGVRVEVPVEQVAAGDVVEVLQGGRVPVDGRVTAGGAWLDESMLTGEPLPRTVAVGDEVSAGTVCTDGCLVVCATRTGGATTLAQISRLVEDAQARRAPVQRVVDRFARFFVMLTMGLAVAAFFWWRPTLGVEGAMIVATSVLIITCPCALGLATPLAVACACGRSAAGGVLFRGGDVLEALQGVTHVLLDKTGTLTEGRLELVDVVTDLPRAEALRLAAEVERFSTHPVARALVAADGLEAARAGTQPPCDAGLSSYDVSQMSYDVSQVSYDVSSEPYNVSSSLAAADYESVPGQGVAASVGGRRVAVGSDKMLSTRGLRLPEALAGAVEERARDGRTVVWMAVDDDVRAAFVLADRVRPEAAAVVAELRRGGCELELLSGDCSGAVEAVARQVGITLARGRMLPADKAARVRELQAAGARVALVGDGINDAPALSAADVGIAVADGTDIAVEAADVVLLRPGLHPLLEALQTARDAFRVIRDNMTVSAMYNCIALPTALCGYVAPLVAAVAMPLSSLFVVASSMRLLRSSSGDPTQSSSGDRWPRTFSGGRR